MAIRTRPGRRRPGVPDDTSRRARVAVAVLFAVNGLIIANVVPWLPEIKSDLALTNTAFGVAWAAGPCGGLLLGMLAGPLSARVGSGRTATGAALVGIAGLPAIALAPTWLALAATLAVMGAADALMDAAMNAHGLRVQRRYGRSIINSFHALWSLGAVGGGLMGSAAVALGVSRPFHLSVVAVVVAVAVVAMRRWQLGGPEDAEQVSHAVAPGPDRAGPDPGQGSIRQALRTAPWLLLGLAGLPTMAGAVEDAAGTWSAIHLRETLDASAFVAGLGFVAAQAAMVVGRVMGDHMVDRFSAEAVARSGSLLAAVGMLAVAAGPSPAVVVAGFALAGLGVSTLFPLGLAAAGGIPGVRSADGIAIASWVARLSFMVMPPIVGAVADALSLRWGLALVVGCALVAAALSGLLDRDD